MRTKLAAMAALALIQTACFGVNEKNWGDKWAQQRCSFSKQCEKATFWYNYADMGECVDHHVNLYEAYADTLDGCTFDKKAARQCLSALKSSCKTVGAEYDDLFDPCDEVWDCGGEETTDTAG